MSKISRESKKVPSEFAQLIARIGGTNFFAEPNFILVWGESHVTRTGLGDMILHPIPAWILMQWHSAEEHGPPSMWDHEVLGPYPTRGMYHPLQPFYERIDRKIVPMELSARTFEYILHIVMEHQHDNMQKRAQLFKDAKDEKDRQLEQRIADNLQDSVSGLAVDAISFAGQRNKHSFIQQMIHRMEAQAGRGLPLKRGLQQIPT